MGLENVCLAKLDLCLIIDSSGSVRQHHEDNWWVELEFLIDFVAGFTIGQNYTRVAAIVFSERVDLLFPLNKFNNFSEVREAIIDAPYEGGTTNTPEALRRADLQCFNAANGDRDDAENVIIIVTDGNPYPPARREPALKEARRIKSKGIAIIGVGIVEDYDYSYDPLDGDFLREISSRNNTFLVTDFLLLETVRLPILEELCLSQERGTFVLSLVNFFSQT